MQVVSKDVAAVVDHLRTLGITKFASLGFCWGCDMAIRMAAEPGSFSAAGFCHPSWFGKEKERAADVKVPICCCSAAGDPLEAVQEVLEKTEVGSKCVYRRFGDMTHGYCAARGDFSKPEVAAAVGETLKILTEFFNTNV
jgi:protein XRP2